MNTEEIFDFKRTIFIQIRTVNGIMSSALSKLCSYCIWSQIWGYFRVHWSTQLSEWLNNVFLSDFKNNARSLSHSFYHSCEFRQYTFINLKKFFSCWFIESEHFHRRNFKPFLKNQVNDLTCKPFLNYMWLYYTAGAVIKCCSCTEAWWKI